MATVRSKDGTTIGYDQVGHGPALVLVDAAGGYRGFGPMGALAEMLAPSFTVITYDRRGRGESTDTLPYAVEREVEDLAAVIDAAGGSAFVEGFSSGAVLGLYAAGQGVPITHGDHCDRDPGTTARHRRTGTGHQQRGERRPATRLGGEGRRRTAQRRASAA
ncbi:hypothetical protein Acor_05320 [Acrocarpospora corrugata]|uniref:AB hydrolase-1 domain-containing protein n=1 Tax=Acrocarpospora corrugata TaxID=35763 RepID=A0A5M3VUQ3_9ACTN|nr:alpha/beta fold hydrolase [Acrocarpospora corrugata]GER98470.1 hypothetical protein Acor_05320 [Acrocarpospora corrugata]